MKKAGEKQTPVKAPQKPVKAVAVKPPIGQKEVPPLGTKEVLLVTDDRRSTGYACERSDDVAVEMVEFVLQETFRYDGHCERISKIVRTMMFSLSYVAIS
jgi:hypothetical protein